MGSMRLVAQTSPVTKGILLTVLALFFLCTMDAAVKSLSDTYTVIQMIWIRYVGQTVLAAALIWRHLPRIMRTRHPILHLLRSLFMFGGSFCFIYGYTNIDLASATTILQTSPLFIAIGAHFVLKEKLGLRRVVGIAVGLVGTLVIIRPGTEVFSHYSLFPLCAAVGYSGYAIATRFLSRDEGVWTSFFYTTLLGTLIASFIVPFNWQAPDPSDLPWFLVVIVFGAAGQYFLIRSLFLVEATVVAPFTYSALIFAAIYGAAVFGEFPDMWTWIGAAVISASGLFVWYRENRAQRG